SGLSTSFTGVFPTSSSASSLSRCKSIEAIWPDPEQETQALLLSGRTAMSSGWWQTGMVLRTDKCPASTSDTVSLPRLLTTTVFPSGETLANPGDEPTAMFATTARFCRSMTETLAEPELAT